MGNTIPFFPPTEIKDIKQVDPIYYLGWGEDNPTLQVPQNFAACDERLVQVYLSEYQLRISAHVSVTSAELLRCVKQKQRERD